jgi:hypothetical protein
MSTIIAGLFENIEHAQDAETTLQRHGFARTDVCHFANNPPGQHDQYPIGGDERADPGAKHAHAGAGIGAGVGAGTGAAVGAVVGGPPGAAVGAGIGAYIGSLAGTLGALDGKGSDERPVRRPAGVMVAARIDTAASEQLAIEVLRAEGATHVEKAEGRWEAGKWADFDPVSVPRVVTDTPAQPPLSAWRERVAGKPGDSVFQVRVRPDSNKWEVIEPGTAASRQFDLRQDAVAHAVALAGETDGASLEVYSREGALVWRETYEATPVVRRRRAGR